MARIYHRDQAGAPSFSYTPEAAASFAAMKLILKACLVEGFGGRQPAGWALVSEGARYLVLRVGSGAGYIGITQPTSSSGFVEVWLSKTYSGVVGDRLQGDGVRSGNSANSSYPQRLSCLHMVSSESKTGWYVVADERSFIFAIASRWDISGSIEAGYSQSFYAGETDTGQFLSVGGVNTTSTSNLSQFSSVGMTLLTHPNTGLLLGGAAVSAVIPALPELAQVTQNLLPGPIEMARIRIFGDGYSAGALRGCVVPVELQHLTTQSVANAMGMSGGFTTRKLNTVIEMSDSSAWLVVPRQGQPQGAAAVCTDNAGFW